KPACLFVCRHCRDAGCRAGNDVALYFLRSRQWPLLERHLERRPAADITCAGKTEAQRHYGSLSRGRRLLRDVSVREGDGADHACRLRNERRAVAAAARFSVTPDRARSLRRKESKVAYPHRAVG